MAVHEAPRAVVELAVKTANLIGDGLYGVDLKQAGDKVVVIEVNDKPQPRRRHRRRLSARRSVFIGAGRVCAPPGTQASRPGLVMRR
jgi:hypothetical protein